MTTAPVDPNEYTFVAQTGRSPYRAMHDKDGSGKIAHFILQWVNTREETGMEHSDQRSCTSDLMESLITG